MFDIKYPTQEVSPSSTCQKHRSETEKIRALWLTVLDLDIGWRQRCKYMNWLYQVLTTQWATRFLLLDSVMEWPPVQ